MVLARDHARMIISILLECDPGCHIYIIQEVKYNLILRPKIQSGESFMPLDVGKIRAVCFDVDGID